MFLQSSSSSFVPGLPVGSSWKFSRPVIKCYAIHAQRAKQFTRVERNELRRRSQDLARTRKLVETQMGRKGLTDTFVDNLSIALKANEFVKVQAGGCDMELSDILLLLEEKSDCTCVHKIGNTLTFYRKEGQEWPADHPQGGQS